MKAVIYMRVGNPDQVTAQHRKEKLRGRFRVRLETVQREMALLVIIFPAYKSFYRKSGDMTDTTT